MKENLIELYNHFKNVRNRGWLESKYDRISGVGAVFEETLGINKNELPIADFCGIEIKCHLNSSRNSLTLFNANFDGDYLFELDRIYKKYSTLNKKGNKVLYAKISGKYIEHFSNIFYAKLYVNRELEKIQLEIYKNNEIIDNEASWSFKYLEGRIYQKIKYLAYIKANSKIINNKIFYKYESIQLYRLRDFNMFLKMIEGGFINVNLAIGTYNSGKLKGKVHNHGIAFKLCENRLKMLFSEGG